MPQISQIPVAQGPVAPAAPALPYIQRPQAPYFPYANPGAWKPKKDPRAEMISKYGDPYELNSLVDALFNREAQRRSGTNMLTAPFKLLWERTLKPISKGEWGVAGLNALVNIGESLDVLANPVKGLLMEGVQSLDDSTGLGTAGRKQYDWNTGNLATDIGLEVISDPFNWISLVGKAAISAAAKAAMKPLMREAAAEVGEIMAKKLVSKTVSAYVDNGMREAAKQVSWADLMKKTAGGMSKTIFSKPMLLSQPTLDLVAARTMNNLNRTVLPALRSLMVATGKVESMVMKSTMASTGLGLTWYGGKALFSEMGRTYQNNVTAKLNPFIAPTGGIQLGRYEEAQQALTEILNITEKADALENIDPRGFQLLMRDTLQNNFTHIETIMKNAGQDYATLKKNLDLFAIGQALPDFPAMHAKMQKLAGEHPGVFDDYMNMLQHVDDQMEELRLYNEARLERIAYKETVDNVEQLEQTFRILPQFTMSELQENLLKESRDVPPLLVRILTSLDPWQIARDIPFLDPNLVSFLDIADVVRRRLDVSRDIYYDLRISPVDIDYQLKFLISRSPTDGLAIRKVMRQEMETLVNMTTAFVWSELKDPTSGLYDVYDEFWFEDQIFKALNDYLPVMQKNIDDVFEIVKSRQKLESVRMPDDFSLPFTDVMDTLNEMLTSSKGVTLDSIYVPGLKDLRSDGKLIKEDNDLRMKSISSKLRKLHKNITTTLPDLLVESLSAGYAPTLGKVHLMQVSHILDDLPQKFNNILTNTNKRLREDVYDLPGILSELRDFAEIFNRSRFATIRNDLDRLALTDPTGANALIRSIDDFWANRADHIDKYLRQYDGGQVQFVLDKKLEVEGLFDLLYNGSSPVKGITFPKSELSKNQQIVELLLEELNLSFRQPVPKFSQIFPEYLEIRFRAAMDDLFGMPKNTAAAQLADALTELRNTVELISDLPSITTSENYVSIKDLMAPLENMLQTYNPQEFAHATVMLTAKEVWYKMQISHIYSLLLLSSDEAVQVPINKLSSTLDAAGEELHNLLKIPELEPAVQKVIDRVNGYMSFQQFFQGFFAANLSPNVRVAMMDSLMRLQQKSPADILTNFEFEFQKLIDAVELQMYSVTMNKKLDLDSLRNFEPFLAAFKNSPLAHTGAFDVDTLVEITLNMMPTLFKDPNYAYFFYDIETTGLNAFIHDVYDISYRRGASGQTVSRLAKTANLPPPSVLLNDLHTTADEFRTRVATHPLTEAESLRLFLLDIAAAQREGLKIQMVGHNVKDFDFKFLKERIFFLSQFEGNHDLARIVDWDALEQVDTMTLLRKQFGYQEILEPEKIVLKDLIYRYVLKESEQSVDVAEGLFQPVTGNFAQDIGSLIELLEKEKTYYDREVIMTTDSLLDVLHTVSRTIWGQLIDLKKMNKSISTLHMQKTILDLMNTNSTKILSVGPDQFLQYAVTRSMDEPAVYNWFDLPIGADADVAKLKRYSKIARKILDKKVAYLRRIYPIQPYAAEVRITLEQIKRYAIPGSMLADMKIPDTLAEQWAWLQYATQKIIKNEELTPGLVVNLSRPLSTTPRGLQTYLYDPSPLYDRTISEGTMSYVDKASGDHGLGEMAVDYPTMLDGFDSSLVEADQVLNSISELADEFGLSLAGKQARSTWFKPRVLVLRDLITHVKDTLGSMRFYKERKAYVTELTEYAKELQKQQTRQAFQISLPDFVRHLYHNGKSIITVDLADFAMEPGFLQDISRFVEQQEELSRLGASVLSQDTRLTFIINENANLTGLLPIRLRELDMVEAEKLVKDKRLLSLLQDSRKQIARDAEEAINGSMGDFLFAKAYQHAFTLIPGAADLLHPELKALLQEGAGIYRSGGFNHSFLGTAGRIAIQPYTPNDIIKVYVNSTRYAVQLPNAKALFLNMYTDPSLQITTGYAFGRMPNERLLEVLQSAPEYRLVALVEDSKTINPQTGELQGFKVINIVPHDVKSIELAKRLGAIIVPTQTYSKMVETINNFQFRGVFKIWHKILFTFKAGYLASFGIIMRNLVDTVLKNSIEGVDMRIQMSTMGIYNQYKICLHDILEADALNTPGILRYFEQPRKITYEAFTDIHDLLNDGPIGQVKEMEQYFIQRGIDKKIAAGLEQTESENQLWATFMKFNQFIMTPNAEVEQIARLAMYLSDMEKGLSKTSAFYHIAKTHFDYTLKSDLERYVELVIPFYTFTMRNLEYWVSAVTEKPWLAGLLRDVMTPVWNLDGYDDDEFRRNRSLQYQVSSGALPLGDSGLTLKLNPSFMDSFNLLIEPFPALDSRIAAPLAFAADKARGIPSDPTVLLPVVGTVLQRRQSAEKYYERSGNVWSYILPSILGATQRWQDYATPAYIKKARQAKTYRARKGYVRKVYARKTWSTNRYRKSYFKMMQAPRFYRGTDLYKKLYTRSGKTQSWMKKIPLTPKTLRFKMRFVSPQFFSR